jgi:MFS family permease
MNRNIWLLALCQGLFLTNNVTFIAINGLVGFALAPYGWMATLPVMGYVVGGALSTSLVARTQSRFGRKTSFQIGLVVAVLSALLGAWGVAEKQFWVVVAATVIAGYYSANGQLYRFAAAELVPAPLREKAVSVVMAGGLIGAVAGPNLAAQSRMLLPVPFTGAYVALALVALLAMVLMALVRFPAHHAPAKGAPAGRSIWEIARQPLFLLACGSAALSFGVMNLLMAATPLAMQQCGLNFDDTALVLEWHVIGMFAPGFFTGHLIKRIGTASVMWMGVVLNLGCIAIALSGQDLHQFVIALFLLGVGWNFLFTGSTTLSLGAYRPEERDRAQGAINFTVFSVTAVTSLASGALITTQGWSLLNWGSLVPVALMVVGLVALRNLHLASPAAR